MFKVRKYYFEVEFNGCKLKKLYEAVAWYSYFPEKIKTIAEFDTEEECKKFFDEEKKRIMETKEIQLNYYKGEIIIFEEECKDSLFPDDCIEIERYINCPSIKE